MTFLYILRCADNTLYIGHTDDVERRVRTHNEGRGGAYTAQRRPVRAIYSECHPSVDAAIKRERQLKRWTRVKKEALVNGNPVALKQLSRSRQRRFGS